MPEVVFPNLGIEIEKLNSVAFSIFGIDIYYYGLIICLGMLAATYYIDMEAKRTGQNTDLYSDFALFAILFGVIGARLYFVVFEWDSYKNDIMKIFATREGGLAIYGGILAGALFAIIYTKMKKINFLLFADTVIPGVVLAQGIGRWGNFFNKEVYGGYTNNLFAMRYLLDEVNIVPQSLKEHIIVENGISYIQVHPTFLYESLLCITIFIIMNFWKFRKKTNGEILTIYLIGYGVGRFFIEGIRVDQLILGNSGLPISQLVSIVLIITGFGIHFFAKSMQKRKIDILD